MICFKFVLYYLIFVNYAIFQILCDNITQNYFTMDKKSFQTRQNRLLTFNTQTNGDISMELAFNVPFITIPVKKSIDLAHGAIANLNVGAVVLAGAIAFGFAVVIPGVTLLLSKTNLAQYLPQYRSEDSKWWQYLMMIEQTLSENNFDTTSCMQRIICWNVKNSSQKIQKGQSSSSDKIIDGLATNGWIQKIISGTIVEEAVKNGLKQGNCHNEYAQCKISQKMVQMFGAQISKFWNLF